MTSKVIYQGDLRTECTHVLSGTTFITDAPTDNQGKGEAFSPTDTVATGLASCMLTIMGIKARELKVDLSGTVAEVTKVMATEPRRISQIKIDVFFDVETDEKSKTILERIAFTCPVYHSLHPDISKDIRFFWKK